jgi:hypothetical protein
MSVTGSQIKAIAGAGARSDLVAAVVKGWRPPCRKQGSRRSFEPKIITVTGLRIPGERWRL